MPDLSGFPALDVAIGLVLMFFLLSTACSAVNEALAGVLGWRAKTLEDGLRSMLGDPEPGRDVKAALGRVQPDLKAVREAAGTLGVPADLTTTVLEQWPVKALVRNPTSKRRRRRRPSYLPPRAVSLAIVRAIVPVKEGDLQSHSDEDLFAALEKAIKREPAGSSRTLLQRAVVQAEGTLDGFREYIETVFDDVMERASGWYKRKAQLTVFLIAAAVAIGLNVDTVHVAERLWNDQAVRSAVAADASRVVRAGTPSAPTQKSIQTAADNVEHVHQLQLPMGRGKGNKPELPDAIPGWILTIAALTLGAPFWFDLLSRLARLRASGVPERPRSLSDTAGTERQERKKKTAAARPGEQKEGEKVPDRRVSGAISPPREHDA